MSEVMYFAKGEGEMVFGPYQKEEFGELIVAGRVDETTFFSDEPTGPWLLLNEYRVEKRIGKYFFKPSETVFGPTTVPELEQRINMGEVDRTCPVGESAQGPWKLMGELEEPRVQSAFGTASGSKTISGQSASHPADKPKVQVVAGIDYRWVKNCSAILAVFGLLGSIAGAGGTLEGFLFASIFNPLLWVSIVFYVVQRHVKCPICLKHSRKADYASNPKGRMVTCSKCENQFRKMW